MESQFQKRCSPKKSFKLDLGPVEGEVADKELSKLAKAIAHPIWVQIIRLLTRKGTCICGEIVDQIPLAQLTVSRTLRF